MIAFLDAEYNLSPYQLPNIGIDQSLIEIAILIVDKNKPNEIVKEYHKYVKPMFHEGRMYSRIKKLTHIDQNLIDDGCSFSDVYNDIQELINEYSISKFYVWGNFDKIALDWNCRQYGTIQNKNRFIKKISDYGNAIKTRFSLPMELGLADATLICQCEREGHHNALADAWMLRDVYFSFENDKHDVERLQEWKNVSVGSNIYSSLVAKMKKLESLGFSKAEIIQLLETNGHFPKFKNRVKGD